MVERACQQNLPTQPPDYDAELATTLAEIVWGALYLKPASARLTPIASRRRIARSKNKSCDSASARP